MSYIGNEPIVSATRTVSEFVATAGQTVFTPSGGYSVGLLDVIVNGATLQRTDFTASNGTSVTLATGLNAGDDVRTVAYGNFSLPANISGATGTGADKVFFENDITVTSNYTLTSGKNAMSAGPVSINAGIVVTVPSGQVWTIV